MKKDDYKKYSFFITLIIFFTGAFISLKLSSEQLKTQSQAKSSISLNSSDLSLSSSYAEDTSASFFTLSGQDTSSKLYTLSQNTPEKVIEFLAQQPQFSPQGIKTYQGDHPQEVQRNLIPDRVENLILSARVDDSQNEMLQSLGDSGDASHYYFHQTRCGGIPVFGSYLNVHVGSEGNNIYNVSGALMKDEAAPCEARISKASAEQIALSALKSFFNTNEAGRVILSDQYMYDPALTERDGAKGSYLTQNVVVCSKDEYCRSYFVDLDSGAVVYEYQYTPDGLNRYVFLGNILRREGGSPVSNNDVNTAYDIMADVYNYFMNTFTRDSYDNQGGQIQVKIEQCAKLNAYWDGNGINICSGLVQNDVLAHEFQHGVTQYAVDPRNSLQYIYESGALNESISDVFGFALDSSDWTMGEGSGLGVIRDMAHPLTKGHPDRMFAPQYYCQSGDNGGVHINSGVFNKAFYLMVTGGTFGNTKGTCTIAAVGKEKAIAVVYKGLITYLKGKSTANYRDMYDAMNSACSDLYGATSGDCTNIKNAMEAVEMNQQTIGCSRGPKCSKTGSAQCGGKSEIAPTCSSGGGVPTSPTIQPTVSAPTAQPTQQPTQQPTSEPTQRPSPTSKPELKKTAQLKSTVSAPNFTHGEVTVEYNGGIYKLKANLNPQSLAGINGSNAQFDPNQPIGAKGYLIGKDRIETGNFNYESDGSIVNSFSTSKDLSSYRTYQVVAIDDKGEELPILIADVGFDQSSTVDMEISLRLQGISQKPTSTEGILVKVGIGGGDLEGTIYQDIPFFPTDGGAWKGQASFDIVEGDLYKVLIKPARHIQKKFCENNPAEEASGLYKCKAERIALKKGKNVLNFINVIQLAGDLPIPKQDGVVNSFDILRLRKSLNSTKYSDLIAADVNSDGIVNAADDALVIFTLGNRSDQN